MEHTINTITVRGSLSDFPQFSHENHGKRFLRFLLEDPRLSGTVDLIPVVAEEQLMFVLETKPEHVAVKEFRKHLIWYFKGIKNAAEYKRKASNVISVSDCKKLLESAKKEF